MWEDYKAEAEGLFQRNTQDSIRVSLVLLLLKTRGSELGSISSRCTGKEPALLSRTLLREERRPDSRKRRKSSLTQNGSTEKGFHGVREPRILTTRTSMVRTGASVIRRNHLASEKPECMHSSPLVLRNPLKVIPTFSFTTRTLPLSLLEVPI